MIICWAFSSIMALAFRCSLPHPWEFTGNCINQVSEHSASQKICPNNMAECTFQIDRSLQHHHRHSSDTTSLHGVLEGASIQIKEMEDSGSVRDKNHCHHSNSDPNTLLRNTRQFFRQNVGEHKFEHVGSVGQTSSLPFSTQLTKPRAMMNLSIIATAIPSLGRLIVELQPKVNAFAITEQHGLRTSDKYVLSSFAGRFPQDYTLENNLGTHTSVRGTRRQSSRGDSESTQGLRQNMIQQTIDFRIY